MADIMRTGCLDCQSGAQAFFHSEDWLNASFLPAAFPMGNVARLCLADFLFFVQFLKIILDFLLDGLPFV